MTKVEINKHAKALYCYEYKGRYCKECGIDSFDNPWIMDFHHIDPKDKEYTISHKIRSARFQEIKKELDKCVLLCTHCHRTLHAKEKILEYRENMGEILNKLKHIKNNDGIGASRIGIHIKYEKSLIEEYVNEGKTITEIAKILNETSGKVTAMLRKFKLETISNKRIRLDSLEDSIIRDYTIFKYTIDKITKRRNMKTDEVKNILIKHNVEFRKNNTNQKIINVDELKKLLQTNMSKAKIARIMGCAETTIHRYCSKIDSGIL